MADTDERLVILAKANTGATAALPSSPGRLLSVPDFGPALQGPRQATPNGFFCECLQ